MLTLPFITFIVQIKAELYEWTSMFNWLNYVLSFLVFLLVVHLAKNNKILHAFISYVVLNIIAFALYPRVSNSHDVTFAQLLFSWGR